MSVAATNSIDFVAARAHGRYARRAAPDVLENLARLGSVRELVRAAGGPAEVDSCAEFEAWLGRDLGGEWLRFAQALEGPRADFIEWLAMATKIEELETRAPTTGTSLEEGRMGPHSFHVAASARTMPGSSPSGDLGTWSFGRAWVTALGRVRGHRTSPGEPSSPVREELALERAYLVELLVRTRRLGGDDRETVLPVVRQEIDLFHLRCALGVSEDGTGTDGRAWRATLHIPGSAIRRDEFLALIGGGAARATDGRGFRRVLGPTAGAASPSPGAATPDLLDLERRAWKRLRRMACRAFRRDPMGLGALAGYVVLRRLAVADLGALAEGLRLGLGPAERRARLLHAPNPEAGHV